MYHGLEIQIGFAFLVPAHPGSPGQRAVKRVCVCVCVCITVYNKCHMLIPFWNKYCPWSGVGRGLCPPPETSPMPFPQPLSRSSLVYLLVWGPVLRTPYIFSPNHLLLATHGNNVATCFAEVPRLSFIPNLSHLTSAELEVPPHFLSLQARSHFDVTYCIAHNCCTTSLGTSKYLLLA